MIYKCLRSFKYAFRGLYLVCKNENNAKIHLCATFVVIAAGVYCKLEKREWLWIILAICMVWILEVLNSAIEKLVDLISPQYNTKAGAIKDIAAGAVLIAAIFSVIIAVVIFTSHV